MDEYENENEYEVYDEKKYKPISPLGYIGYEILYALPVIGWLCVIIFSLAPKNQNVKNFARAQLIVVIFCICVGLIIGALAVASGFDPGDFYNSHVESV